MGAKVKGGVSGSYQGKNKVNTVFLTNYKRHFHMDRSLLVALDLNV